MTVIPGSVDSPFAVICEHAHNALPAGESLGLSPEQLRCHIGWDIAAEALTRRLAELLDSPAFLHPYSRLLADPNRALERPDVVPDVSDGVVIPANVGLSAQQRAERIRRFHHGFHRPLARALRAMERQGHAPILINIHTCTRALATNPDEDRPDIGILWRTCAHLAGRVLDHLSRGVGERYRVASNKPYNLQGPRGLAVHTIIEHGEKASRPTVLFEVCSDLLTQADGITPDPVKVDAMARTVAGAVLRAVLEDGFSRTARLPSGRGWKMPERDRAFARGRFAALGLG